MLKPEFQTSSLIPEPVFFPSHHHTFLPTPSGGLWGTEPSGGTSLPLPGKELSTVPSSSRTRGVSHVTCAATHIWRQECKPLQYSCLENPMNSMKRQNDRILKEELPGSVGAQYATGDQWRNNARKNEGTLALQGGFLTTGAPGKPLSSFPS